jgi:uncharacterized protein
VSEYLAPGVYVEETSFRSKSIEGVSTSTTGFAGPTRKGPSGDTPELLTSFADFERIYGGLQNLAFSDLNDGTNYLAHAVRSYFNEGGSRLYVARVSNGGGNAEAATANGSVKFVARFPGAVGNGTAQVFAVTSAATPRAMSKAPEGTVVAKDWGGAAAQPAILTGGAPTIEQGKATFDATAGIPLKVNGEDTTISFQVGTAEITSGTLTATVDIDPQNKTLHVVVNGVEKSIVLTEGTGVALQTIANQINLHIPEGFARAGATTITIGAVRGSSGSIAVSKNEDLGFAQNLAVAQVTNVAKVTIGEIDQAASGVGVRASIVSGKLTLTTVATGDTATLERTGGTAVGGLPAGEVNGSAAASSPEFFVKKGAQWVETADETQAVTFGDPDVKFGDFFSLTVVTTDGDGVERAYEGLGLSPSHPRWIGSVLSQNPSRRSEHVERLFAINIQGTVAIDALIAALLPGSGGSATFAFIEGSDGAAPQSAGYSDALKLLGGIEDISIVAAPGSSMLDPVVAHGVRLELISHAETRRSYRIAVLEAPRDTNLTEVRTIKSQLDSKYAALYYPWVVVANPAARASDENAPKEIALPPSGFITGIYARNDIERGVFKAPANEVVRSALRFHSDVNFAQQEVLNPLGINCLRFFPGRGYRVWGARTVSSDPEWKYVNVRRYFNYLERSIDNGTQWAVFEPNGERLWANIRETISSFLYNEWRSGALLGEDPKQAYFVRCDRSTMDQNDLDNGRLICLIGVAVVKPAEFVIFRIGQKTADARN